MAVINPAGFLQNAGATHTAEQLRDWHGLLLTPARASSSLVSRGGVNLGIGFSMAVTQTGSPSMAVIVRSGAATVGGSEGSKQGSYSVLNDADVTLSITAAHATLNRIDLVCFKIEDQAYSGSVNTSSLVVVTGTPASSPSAPTAPNNSITLAQVFIGAAVSSIVNANITDQRPFMAAVGGLVNVGSSTERDALIGFVGLGTYRRDKNRIEIHDGTAYRTYPPVYRDEVSLGGSAANVTFSNIPSTLRNVRITFHARSDAAVQNDYLFVRVNSDSSALYSYTIVQGLNATGSVASVHSDTRGNCGCHAGASASSNWFGSGSIDFQGWDQTANTVGYTYTAQAMGTAVASHLTTSGGGNYANAVARTGLQFLPASGNFIAGTTFILEGTYPL